jgi:RNA-binding protein 25
MLDEKLKTFAMKKVEEILGEPEEELVSFIMDHIRERKPPQDLVQDLTMALDEEAVRLVARLWRMLIYETEAYAQGLS